MLRSRPHRPVVWLWALALTTGLLTISGYADLPATRMAPAAASESVRDPNFPYLATVTGARSAVAKSGDFGANWVELFGPGGVAQVAITSDQVNGPTTALRFNDGAVVVKTGGLSTNWVTIAPPVAQVAVASQPNEPPFVLILRPNGDLFGRRGLTSPDTMLRQGVAQVAAAADSKNGLTVLALDKSGLVTAKNPGLGGAWLDLSHAGNSVGAQIAVASDPVHGQTVAMRNSAGIVSAKTGGLSTDWAINVAGAGATQVAVASDPVNGPSIVAIKGDGTVAARTGSVAGPLTTIFNQKPAREVFVSSDPTLGPFVAVLATDNSLVAKMGPTISDWRGFLDGVSGLSTTTAVPAPPQPSPAPTSPTTSTAQTSQPPTPTKPTAGPSGAGSSGATPVSSSAPGNAGAAAAGSSPAAPAQAPGPVTSGSPAPTAITKITLRKAPVVSGKRRPGRRLQVLTMDFVPTDCKVQYRWLRNRRTIAKATSSSYRFTRRDVGKKLTVRIRFTYHGMTPLVHIVNVQKPRRPKR